MIVGITFSTFDLFQTTDLTEDLQLNNRTDVLLLRASYRVPIDRPEKNPLSQSIIQRYIQLKGSKHVDEIVPYVSEQDLEDILGSFKLDVRII